MSIDTNVIEIYKGNDTYTTIQLDNTEDGDSFIDIGSGLEPICARVFMHQSEIDKLPSEIVNGTDPVGFRIKSTKNNDSGNPEYTTLTFAQLFYIERAIIRSTADFSDALYEIKLSTIQRWWQFTQYSTTWNTLSKDRLSFIYGAITASTPHSWRTIIQDVLNTLNISNTTLPVNDPVWNPFNFGGRYLPAVVILRRLLLPLGLELNIDPIVRADHPNETLTIDYLDNNTPTYPTSSLIAGDTILQGSGVNTFIPESVDIVFPSFVCLQCDGTPDQLRTQYKYATETFVSGLSSMSGSIETIFVNDHFDTSNISEDPKLYVDDLSGIANERALRYSKRMSISHKMSVFAGAHDLIPDANTGIRRVRWTVSDNGLFTLVWRHGYSDYAREDLEKHFSYWKSTHFPEIKQTDNYADGSNVFAYPGDDGTVTFDIPNIGDCKCCPTFPVGSLCSLVTVHGIYSGLTELTTYASHGAAEAACGNGNAMKVTFCGSTYWICCSSATFINARISMLEETTDTGCIWKIGDANTSPPGIPVFEDEVVQIDIYCNDSVCRQEPLGSVLELDSSTCEAGEDSSSSSESSESGSESSSSSESSESSGDTPAGEPSCAGYPGCELLQNTAIEEIAADNPYQLCITIQTAMIQALRAKAYGICGSEGNTEICTENGSCEPIPGGNTWKIVAWLCYKCCCPDGQEKIAVPYNFRCEDSEIVYDERFICATLSDCD